MGTENEKKIPSNYFLYPEFLAFVLLPVTWGLLPIAGFYPELLGVEMVIKFQDLFAITFKTIVFIHCFELLYATYRCLTLGLTLPTMLKWLISVSLNGVFALKMLHDPEKFYNVVKKEKSNWKKIE